MPTPLARRIPPHVSDGPHFGNVRTFINPTLLDALTRNAPDHPIGAATIKELYSCKRQLCGPVAAGHCSRN